MVEIDASPMNVWSVLTDLDAYPLWHSQISIARGQIVVGERVTFRMTQPGRRAFTIHPKVVRAEPGRRLSLLGSVPLLFSALGEQPTAPAALYGPSDT